MRSHPGTICKSQIALGDTNDSSVNLKGDLWQDDLLTPKILKKGPFTLPLSPNAKIAQLKNPDLEPREQMRVLKGINYLQCQLVV